MFLAPYGLKIYQERFVTNPHIPDFANPKGALVSMVCGSLLMPGCKDQLCVPCPSLSVASCWQAEITCVGAFTPHKLANTTNHDASMPSGCHLLPYCVLITLKLWLSFQGSLPVTGVEGAYTNLSDPLSTTAIRPKSKGMF